MDLSSERDIEVVFDDASITGRGMVATVDGSPAGVRSEDGAITERSQVVLVRITERGVVRWADGERNILFPGDYVITMFGLAKVVDR